MQSISSKESPIILEAKNLSHDYHAGTVTVHALRDVSLSIYEGEILGLAGESGSGKSTLAHILAGIIKPADGEVLYRDVSVAGKRASAGQKRLMQRQLQMIFQDAGAAMDPLMSIEKIVQEPFRIQKRTAARAELREKTISVLRAVGMDESMLARKPGELSGGQRQKVAMARCLMAEPDLVIADEPLSALDISMQAQITELFRKFQERHAFSMLFIAHDPALLRILCGRIGVMYRGRLVELAPSGELFDNPQHPVTRSLLSAMRIPDPALERGRRIIRYDGGTQPGGVFAEHSPGHYVLR